MTDVQQGQFHLRTDTSTLVAVVAAKYTPVDMVRAAGGRKGAGGGRRCAAHSLQTAVSARPPLQWSFHLHFGSLSFFEAESLRLCFDSEAAAQEWHSQLATAIRRLERISSGGACARLRCALLRMRVLGGGAGSARRVAAAAAAAGEGTFHRPAHLHAPRSTLQPW